MAKVGTYLGQRRERERGQSAPLVQWFAKWAMIAVVYGAINSVMVAGQHLWHGSDQKRLDALKQQIAAEKLVIDNSRSDLDRKHSRLNEMEWKLHSTQLGMMSKDAYITASRNELESFEASLVPGVSATTYRRYSVAVNRHNALVRDYNGRLSNHKALYGRYKTLLAEHNSQVPGFNQHVQRYNKLVREANQVAQKVGTTWYLVPVPSLGGSRNNEAPASGEELSPGSPPAAPR